MKILMLNYEYPPVGGGGATITAQLCRHLAGLGHSVDAATMRWRDLPHEETVNGVRIFRFPSYRRRADICRTPEMATYLLGAWRPALALARRNSYDVIHAHFIVPTSPLARHIQQHTGIPYLVTCHGSDVPGYNPDRFGFQHKLLLPYWKKLVHSADALTSPSASLKHLMLRSCPDLNIHIVPNGYEPLCFDTTRPREKKILLCSRLLPRKGFQYVIEAVKNVSLDWQVHIVGDGPFLETLQQMAAGSKTPIVFHGWLDRSDSKFKDLYETSSIFVFPSEMENFPAVLLEAMSAGLAIITSTAGGCPEVVGNAGLLIEPKNPQAIHARLTELIGNEEVRNRLAKQAKERSNLFSWDTVAQKYIECYQSIIVTHKNS